MKPWVQIARAEPGDGGTLSLHRRDEEFVIRAGGQVLMSSRRHGSEERMAEIGCDRLGDPARVLVGGLGMGFTLRAVLDLLPDGGQVIVAELFAEVVDWNRGVLAPLAGRPLDDSRVTVHTGDVLDAMALGPGFDAILLDVDNSPHALTWADNQRLYEVTGLGAAARALRTDGCLAIWSASRAPELARRMKRVGFTVEIHEERAFRGAGTLHAIYVGRRHGSAS